MKIVKYNTIIDFIKFLFLRENKIYLYIATSDNIKSLHNCKVKVKEKFFYYCKDTKKFNWIIYAHFINLNSMKHSLVDKYFMGSYDNKLMCPFFLKVFSFKKIAHKNKSEVL